MTTATAYGRDGAVHLRRHGQPDAICGELLPLAGFAATPAERLTCAKCARAVRPKAGQRFTHRSALDLSWRPGPGQRYANAPKAECVVTSVHGDRVFYRYADSEHAAGTFTMPLARWEADYS